MNGDTKELTKQNIHFAWATAVVVVFALIALILIVLGSEGVLN